MFFSNKGADLFTVDFGIGKRTLFAHGGWTGSWELWAPTFNILSKSWRTAAFDHRGSGATAAPAETITLDILVDDLFAVLDRLEIDHCVLAGESSGAMVVILAALKQPQRFDGLVLVDGLYFQPTPENQNAFIQGLRSNYEVTVNKFVDACIPENEPDKNIISRWGRQILGRSTPEASIRLLEIQFGVDLRPEVSRLTLPTLILHGDLDIIVPVASSKWLAENIPNSHLELIKGAGHVPTITHGREVAHEIASFFD
jgi:pimeloyl-ACP methyl ester carboxylesterase